MNWTETYKFAILSTIEHFGGVAELKNIYKNVKDYVHKIDNVNEMYQVPSNPNDIRPLFHHNVRAVIDILKKENYITRIDRATYSLTKDGKSILKELKENQILNDMLEKLKKK